MRARNIKPGFFKNEILAECKPLTRILFSGLWCMADKEGRLEDRPARIKAEILPYDNHDINGELTVLQRKGFIQRYKVGDLSLIKILHFKDHQRPHHTEAESKLPDITSEGCLTVNSPLKNGENPPDSLIPDSLIPDVGKNAASDKSDLAARLESVKQNPAYKGIDIEREYYKMVEWCQSRNRIPSYRRLVNWLNRIERPMLPLTEPPKPKLTLDEIVALQKAGLRGEIKK